MLEFFIINSINQEINGKKVKNIPIGELVELGYLINWSELFGGFEIKMNKKIV